MSFLEGSLHAISAGASLLSERRRACHVWVEGQRESDSAPPALPFALDVLPGTRPAMSALLSMLWSATLQCPDFSGLPCLLFLPACYARFRLDWPAMSFIFARNILCHAVPCPVKMACHVSSPARLDRRLPISPLVFAPGFHIFEGLPCLHITHFGYEKGLNDLLPGGAPCPLARIDAAASCAVQRGPASGEAVVLWYTAVS